MRLKRPIMLPLLLIFLLSGVLLSACSSTTAHPTAPTPTPDLEPTVEALVSQRLEDSRQEDAARAEMRRRIAEILTPAPTALPTSTATPGPAPTLLPIRMMGPENEGFVDPSGRFQFSWWPPGWGEDTDFGKALVADISPLFVSNIVFFGGNPIPGGYNPNLMVMRLVVPSTTELDSLVDQELHNLKLAYPGIRIVDRRPTSLDGVPAVLVTSHQDDDALQFFYLFMLKDNREWFIQCTRRLDLTSDAEDCRKALDGFSLTVSPGLN